MASTKAPFIKYIGAHNSLPLKVYKLSLKINLPMEKIDGFYFCIPTLALYSVHHVTGDIFLHTFDTPHKVWSINRLIRLEETIWKGTYLRLRHHRSHLSLVKSTTAHRFPRLRLLKPQNTT